MHCSNAITSAHARNMAEKRAAEMHESSRVDTGDVAANPPIKRPELESRLTLQLPLSQPRPTSPATDAAQRKRTPSFLRDVYVGDAHSPQVHTLHQNSKSRRDHLTRKSLQNVLKAQGESQRPSLSQSVPVIPVPESVPMSEHVTDRPLAEIH